MRRIFKGMITLFLALVLMLSLCTCAENPQQETKTEETKLIADEEGKHPFSEEAEQSLVLLRERINFPQIMFGAAYLGYVGEDAEGDWKLSAEQAMLQKYPFLEEMDADHIIGSVGHLYCIVPVDENATVSINRVKWNENTRTDQITQVLYRSEKGEPVLLFANLDGIAYESDTQILITDNEGNSCEWTPSLDGMSYLAPCVSKDGDNLLFDFTEYGWQDTPSEFASWLSDGYQGVHAAGLKGCWRTQATAWGTDRTANYFLWFFPEKETGGSIRLDWQYEGLDLFEEMWRGYWTITSVLDGPSYVTIRLSLVGGENYGNIDGPYYISETYPLVISPSGEEIVVGAGARGVSLPFMPENQSQLCTLTLDYWFTENLNS